jgi:hypothetical protein
MHPTILTNLASTEQVALRHAQQPREVGEADSISRWINEGGQSGTGNEDPGAA